MPNWATNTLLITGPDTTLNSVRIAFGDPTDEARVSGRSFDFNLLMPIPADLENTASPTEVFETQEQADAANAEWAVHPSMPNAVREIRAITGDRAAALRREHGGINWYDWAVTHWGTKWSGSDLEVLLDVPGAVVVRFCTAWVAPHGVLNHLHEKLGLTVIGGVIHEDGDEFEEITLFDLGQTNSELFTDFFTLVTEEGADEVFDSSTQTLQSYPYSNRYIAMRDDIREVLPPAILRFADAAATLIEDHAEEQD